MKKRETSVRGWHTRMGERERATRRVANDIGHLNTQEFKSFVAREVLRRKLTPTWLPKEVKKNKEAKTKENQRKQAEAEARQRERQQPTYRFALLAQLASHKREERKDKLMSWKLEDLKTVLKEIKNKSTLRGIPSYRLAEAKQDLINTINFKTALEIPQHPKTVLEKVTQIFRGH